jgi:uncharacterized protein
MNYYPYERLGEQQSLTKEGFLLVTDVPMARTGMMLYGPGEVPVDPAPGEGLIYIHREPEEVFRPETMASMIGKPVVIYHPDRDVTPDNWDDLAIGTVISTRRGAVPDDDMMFGDIVITKRRGIQAIREEGLREVSCGYDAKYEETVVPGHANQRNIHYNHLALVDSARCGPRCAIGDRQTVRTGDCSMSWIDKVRAAFTAKDETALNAALSEAPRGETVQLTTAQLETIARTLDAKRTHDADHPDDCDCKMCKREKTNDSRLKKVEDSVDAISKDVKKMKDDAEEERKEKEKEEEKAKDNTAILGQLELEAPPGSGDAAMKAKDSAYVVDSFQESIALAEIITPGVQIPTYDAAAPPKKTLDALCKFRKQVLEVALTKPEYKLFMDGVLSGRTIDACDCNSVRTIFRATGQFAKNFNNRTETSDARTQDNGKPKKITLAELNKINREFYAGAAK